MKAICTWGMAEDITLELDGKDEPPEGELFVLEENLRHKRVNPRMCEFTHGFVCKGSMGLAIYQAKALVESLQAAIAECERLDKQVAEDADKWLANHDL